MKNKDKTEERTLNYYSRQIGTFGLNTKKKLSKLNDVIFGLRGFGLEIAKNTILSGTNKVYIYDYHIARINDLNSIFYLQEEDIDKKHLDEALL